MKSFLDDETENNDETIKSFYDLIDTYQHTIIQVRQRLSDPEYSAKAPQAFLEAELEEIRFARTQISATWKKIDEYNKSKRIDFDERTKSFLKRGESLLKQAQEAQKGFLGLLTLISTGSVAGIFTLIMQKEVCDIVCRQLYRVIYDFAAVIVMIAAIWIINYFTSIVGALLSYQLLKFNKFHPTINDANRFLKIGNIASIFTIVCLIGYGLMVGYVLLKTGLNLKIAYDLIGVFLG